MSNPSLDQLPPETFTKQLFIVEDAKAPWILPRVAKGTLNQIVATASAMVSVGQLPAHDMSFVSTRIRGAVVLDLAIKVNGQVVARAFTTPDNALAHVKDTWPAAYKNRFPNSKL